jgi:hypothetical protein
MLSSLTSAGVGILASKIGLGGFVSSVAASLAGAYVNAEVMPRRNGSDAPSSTGHVEYSHNGQGFRAVGIDISSEQLRATIDKLKENFYAECLDQEVPVEVATEMAEDQVAEFEDELLELAKEAKDIQTPIEEHPAKSTKAKQSDQQARDTADLTMQMMDIDPLAPRTQMEADVARAFHDASLRDVQLTPSQKVELYKPKNEYEENHLRNLCLN